MRLSLLLVLFLTVGAEADADIESLECLTAWDTQDSTAGFSLTPHAMTLDPLGRLWVLDRARGRVMRLDTDRDGGSLAITGRGRDLSVAGDLAASGAFLYILDPATPHVSLLDLDGHFRKTVDLAMAVEEATSRGFLPSRILVDRSGDLWLIEGAGGAVLRIDRRGRFLDAPLEALSGGKRPARIAGAALGPGDELHLLDPVAPRILVLGPDGILRDERLLEGTLREPASLAVDISGRRYVAEATGRVRILSSDNRLLWDGMLPGPPATGLQGGCVIGDSILCRADPVRGTIRRWRVISTGSEDASD